MLKNLGIILVCIFIGVSLFSFSKSVALFWNSESLRKQINEVYKPKIAKLEQENSKFNDEIAKVRNSLLAMSEENRILKEDIILKGKDLKQTKALLEEKEKALVQLTSKYNELNNENNLLKDKFNAVFLEFIEMRKTLSSVEALKKAIDNLKTGSKKNKEQIIISKEKIKDKKNKITKEITKQDNILYGNRGYFVRDGKNTYVAELKIKVLPVDE